MVVGDNNSANANAQSALLFLNCELVPNASEIPYGVVSVYNIIDRSNRSFLIIQKL